MKVQTNLKAGRKLCSGTAITCDCKGSRPGAGNCCCEAFG